MANAPELETKKPELILGRGDIARSSRSVLGIGIDIVETERIEQSLEKFDERFLKRIFHPDEIAYAQSMKFPALHLAARFAAKEAISKAFGTRNWETPRVDRHGNPAQAERRAVRCSAW